MGASWGKPNTKISEVYHLVVCCRRRFRAFLQLRWSVGPRPKLKKQPWKISITSGSKWVLYKASILARQSDLDSTFFNISASETAVFTLSKGFSLFGCPEIIVEMCLLQNPGLVDQYISTLLSLDHSQTTVIMLGMCLDFCTDQKDKATVEKHKVSFHVFKNMTEICYDLNGNK